MQANILMSLARWLPHGTARRLGASLGRVAGRLEHGARRNISSNLRAAFPESDKDRLASLTGDAFAHRAAAIMDGASACRFDARALCRRLSFDGWSRLDASRDGERGLLVLGAGFGCWQLAALAVALYRGPIETLGPWRDDPVFGRLAANLERHAGQRLFGELAGGEQIEWSLLAGDHVGFLADRADGHGDVIALPFLGQTIQAKTLVATASIDTGAPVVPVFCRPRSRGRWRIQVREPIHPKDEDAATLSRRYLRAVETEVRRRPNLWLGWHHATSTPDA